MRIAVLCHALHNGYEVESEYLIGLLADRWRQEGHDVRFLIGFRERWSADLAILHVDFSVVPRTYLKFARRYPITINDRITDIRKSVISKHLIGRGSDYEGPVIVKTDLNSAGIPERRLLSRGRSGRLLDRAREVIPGLLSGDEPLEFIKRYSIHESLRHVPEAVLTNPDLVVERFCPEIQDNLYFTRRCYVLGDRAVSHRFGRMDPVEGGFAPVFEWIENSPKVLQVATDVGLDFGAVDYTEHDGEVVIFDVNKTVGVSSLENEEVRRNLDESVRLLAPGIHDLLARSPVQPPWK